MQLAFFCLRALAQRHEIVGLPYGTLRPADMPITKKIRQITRNRKNNNLAIPAAAVAILVNPKSAATSAIIKKLRPNAACFTSSRNQSHQLTIARVFLT
jgi:hypothetical protein